MLTELPPLACPTLLAFPVTVAVCDDTVAPLVLSNASSALAASGSALRALVSAACNACALAESFGSRSASPTASAPAGLASFPLIQCQMDSLPSEGVTNATASAA